MLQTQAFRVMYSIAKLPFCPKTRNPLRRNGYKVFQASISTITKCIIVVIRQVFSVSGGLVSDEVLYFQRKNHRSWYTTQPPNPIHSIWTHLSHTNRFTRYKPSHSSHQTAFNTNHKSTSNFHPFSFPQTPYLNPT